MTVEYKESKTAIPANAYESISAFSNRYGGYIIFGADDNGKPVGINPNCLADMKKNFTNQLNNPDKMSPTLYLSLEEFEIKGKILLSCFVPCSSTVVKCNGRIYDRNEEHEWLKMTDKDLFISAGLYEKDFVTGEKGYNLAAVMLFGKDTTIRSCCPGYITDAIYRVDNIDRYDDRLRIQTNLIESYDRLKTENWCRPRRHGNILQDEFSPDKRSAMWTIE